MKPLLWCVCVVKGHVLNGPDECHTLDGIPFFRWHCSRCLVMFGSAFATARISRRGGFLTAVRSMLFEVRILPDRVRCALLPVRCALFHRHSHKE